MPITECINMNTDGSSSTFLADEIRLFSSTKHPLKFSLCLEISSVQYFYYCWHYQENNDNGQVMTNTRNFKNPAICVVNASLRICAWHAWLILYRSISLAIFVTGQTTLNHSVIHDQRSVY